MTTWRISAVRNFELEVLESRILLSGQPLTPSATVDSPDSSVAIHIPLDAETQSAMVISAGSQPGLDSIFDVSGPQVQTSETASASAAVGTPATPESAVSISGSDTPILNKSIIADASGNQAGATAPSPILEQLTQTLKSANGPPMGADGSEEGGAGNTDGGLDSSARSLTLEELTLVDNDLSRLRGQVFYLDFDGAS